MTAMLHLDGAQIELYSRPRVNMKYGIFLGKITRIRDIQTRKFGILRDRDSVHFWSKNPRMWDIEKTKSGIFSNKLRIQKFAVNWLRNILSQSKWHKDVPFLQLRNKRNSNAKYTYLTLFAPISFHAVLSRTPWITFRTFNTWEKNPWICLFTCHVVASTEHMGVLVGWFEKIPLAAD